MVSYLRYLCLTQVTKIFPVFSSRSLVPVYDPFELFYTFTVYKMWIKVHTDMQLYQQFLLQNYSLTTELSVSLLESQLFTCEWIYLFTVYLVLWICLYTLATTPSYCSCVNLEIRWLSLLLCFFFQSCLVILGPLQFHMNFRINLSVSTKMCTGILIGIALHL